MKNVLNWSLVVKSSLALLFLLTAVSGQVFGQTAAGKVLTLAGAKSVVAAATAEAKKNGAGGSIAVVDQGGHLLCLERLDSTFPAAANISILKARSAAMFRRPTGFFEDAIRNGRLSLLANPELMPLQGGVPIVIEGEVVGAVGVAGAASSQQDEEIARAAAQVIR